MVGKKMIKMKDLVMILTALLMGMYIMPLQGQSTTNDPAKSAQALLDEGVKNGHFAGIVAGILKRERIVWMGASGYRDMEHEIAADTGMVHRIASIAKPMTAVAIMQLVEAGKIDLDASVQTYLPRFPEKKEGQITIRHLLSHSSGIRDYKGKKEGFPRKHYATLTEAMAVFQDRKLRFSPGEQFGYATYNYVVLGVVIEAVTSQSYESYMLENIWKPAGMIHTRVEWAGKSYDNKAKLYQQSKSGQLVPAPPTDLSLKIPGGGLQSTIGDLLRFGQAIISNQLISRASLEILIKDTGLKTEGNPYGMGWYLYGTKDSPSGRMIGHSGGQTGTAAQLNIFLDVGGVFAGFTNTSTWNDLAKVVFGLTEFVNGFE